MGYCFGFLLSLLHVHRETEQDAHHISLMHEAGSFLGPVECLHVVLAARAAHLGPVCVPAWLVFTVSALILCSN